MHTVAQSLCFYGSDKLFRQEMHRSQTVGRRIRIADGSQEELMLALRRMASAFGMKEVAESSKLNPKTLYRTLSSAGNPELRSFQAILGAMGMRLAVTPLAREHQQ